MTRASAPDDGTTERFLAAQEVARAAGATALGYFARRGELAVDAKGAQNRATEADRAVEEQIRAALLARFPGDGFLGEEMTSAGVTPAGPEVGLDNVWVVDPIDGTDCFIFGIPAWCISIAWVEDGTVKLGIVFDPLHDELYGARLGGGAWLNGAPIKVSAARALGDGIVGYGYSTRITAAAALEPLERLIARGGMFNRCGSGALAIAWVAAGRLIGYFEPHINSWDCLAALLLVREAGGWTNDFLENDGLRLGNPVIAAAPGLVAEMQAVAGADRATILELRARYRAT